jgi:hypothetical protein
MNQVLCMLIKPEYAISVLFIVNSRMFQLPAINRLTIKPVLKHDPIRAEVRGSTTITIAGKSSASNQK